VHVADRLEGDLRLFGTWARQVATLGPALTYQPGFFLDYPPGYLYALWVVGLLARALNASGLVLRMIVESPALFADFLLAATVYGFVRPYLGRYRKPLAFVTRTVPTPLIVKPPV